MNPTSEQAQAIATQWLLESDEPWTRYRTLVDLLYRPEDDPVVSEARAHMLSHPQVSSLAASLSAWGDQPLKRHNDAGHPIYKLSTLADFGITVEDILPDSNVRIGDSIKAVMAHQSREGAFQTLLYVPERFGGTGQDTWAWMACDAPALLYSLLTMGLAHDSRLPLAIEHLVNLCHENGWRCAAAPELGKFRGPGRKDDPCPIANVYTLRALAQVPALADSHALRTGAETLLSHWERQGERKFYLFGIGTEFRKLKYPHVWYDILHVVETLSRYPFAHTDPRFLDMVRAIISQGDETGRYTATSMYRAWQGWSFASKKEPSPWLTFLVLRILKRIPWQ